MLVLSRACGQSIVVGKHAEIIIKVLKNENGVVNIGIDAPREIAINRLEVYENLLHHSKGQPIKQFNTKAWKKALKRAGIENFRWHDLRHTWASWHVQNGTSLQELQQLGGWASFVMVLRYAHLSSEHLKAVAERTATISLQSKSMMMRTDENGCLSY